MMRQTQDEKKRKTILLVEDEIMSALVTTTIVESFGYTVIVANTGQKAIEIAYANENIQMLLMDIDLGKGMDGPQAAKQILAKRNIPVVFLTSHSEKEYVDRVEEITRYGFVAKNSGNFVLQSSIQMAFELFEAHGRKIEMEKELQFKNKELEAANEELEAMNKELLVVNEELEKSNRDLQETEKTLLYSEDKFRKAFKSSPDSIAITRLLDGLFVSVNQGFSELTGYTEEETVGKTSLEINIWKYPEDRRKIVERLKTKGEVRDYEAHFLTKKGEIFGSMSAVIIELKGVPHILNITRDITARKRLENLLRESQEKLHQALRLANIGVWDWNATNDTVTWSEELYHITGIDPRFPAPTYSERPDINSAQSRGIIQATVQKAIQTGEPYQLEHELIRPDGSTRWVNTFGGPNFDENGRTIGLYGIVQDITDRKLSEDKIQNLLKEKELLLREVHHRMKNNMNTIRGLLMLQADTLKDPAAIAALNDAENRVMSMMVLYDKLYRSASVKEIATKEYLPTLIDQIIGNFPNRSVVTVEKRIENFMIRAETLSSVSIIINEILTNAMKHAFKGRDHGGITVTASQADQIITITIADDGVGIPPSVGVQNSIGFGLQLVEMLVKQIQGTIKIERDHGTKFSLSFRDCIKNVEV